MIIVYKYVCKIHIKMSECVYIYIDIRIYTSLILQK